MLNYLKGTKPMSKSDHALWSILRIFLSVAIRLLCYLHIACVTRSDCYISEFVSVKMLTQHFSEISVSNQYLINIDPTVFAIRNEMFRLRRQQIWHGKANDVRYMFFVIFLVFIYMDGHWLGRWDRRRMICWFRHKRETSDTSIMQDFCDNNR